MWYFLQDVNWSTTTTTIIIIIIMNSGSCSIGARFSRGYSIPKGAHRKKETELRNLPTPK
jgi:hypothetical protein